MNAFDTNVLIYACAEGGPDKQARALELLHDTHDGVLLWQVACEFIAASRKLVGQGFMPEDAWERLAEYMDLFPLVLPTRKVSDLARDLHLRSRLSYWDALIVGACLDAGVRRLYSEDLPGRIVDGPIEIINPFN